jgi:flagellar hook-basal body complex protein FliE
MAIQGINPIAPVPSIDGITKPGAASGASKEFGDLFNDAIGAVEKYRVGAEESANRFMSGENEEIHQVILSGQRAEIAFETFLQVRNKAVQAYQEIMRMQM